MSVQLSSPYRAIPAAARWRESMSGRTPRSIDPHFETGCLIDPTDKVASAGSCFAQRIAEALKKADYHYFVVENGPPFLSPSEKRDQGYGVYSARYGNIYTSLQLLQLLRRAFGRFEPAEPLWRTMDGRYVDPFRPAAVPGNFITETECLADRATHLGAVRRMFENMDVFIFTLGLTEAWISASDGAVFPVCPGSGLGGEYKAGHHVFHNFSVGEVVEHLGLFLNELADVNPKVKVIFTVSPVPLMATFEARHVLQSTVYSKSVLRVAVEEIVRRHANAYYFASYEIVTATGDSRSYLQEDLRTVTEAAVAHVIECFQRWSMGGVVEPGGPGTKNSNSEALVTNPEVMCDEDLISAALAAASA